MSARRNNYRAKLGLPCGMYYYIWEDHERGFISRIFQASSKLEFGMEITIRSLLENHEQAELRNSRGASKIIEI